MLLNSETKKVINLINDFDNLDKIDKVRLALYLMENKIFNTNFNIRDIVILLKEVLNKLDPNYSKTIVNFANYKHLLFFSAKYLELTEKEKKQFSVEMLFNIFNEDFNDIDIDINNAINQNLLIFDYCYCLFN